MAERDEGLSAPPLPDPLGGKNRIGRYAIVKRLAVGGMASIYLGHALGKAGFEKMVAIKRPHRHLVKRETTRMMINEARLVARLDHENICPIIDFDADEDGPYIVMPYLHGETMGSLITHFAKTEVRPVDMFVHLAASIAEGLQYAHDAVDEDGRPMRIIHRDVSPQNILVTFQGSTKILDFGVAKAIGFEAGTQIGVLKGKYAYMSPEQIRGEALDRRSDIFSLGAVLWECLAGRRLFRRENDGLTILAIGEGRAPLIREVNPHVPEVVEKIIERALEPDREQRYANAVDFAHALRAHLVEKKVAFGAGDVARWMSVTFPIQANARSPLAAPTEIDVALRVKEPSDAIEAVTLKPPLRTNTPTATDGDLAQIVFEHSTRKAHDTAPTLNEADSSALREAIAEARKIDLNETPAIGDDMEETWSEGNVPAKSESVTDAVPAPSFAPKKDAQVRSPDTDRTLSDVPGPDRETEKLLARLRSMTPGIGVDEDHTQDSTPHAGVQVEDRPTSVLKADLETDTDRPVVRPPIAPPPPSPRPPSTPAKITRPSPSSPSMRAVSSAPKFVDPTSSGSELVRPVSLTGDEDPSPTASVRVKRDASSKIWIAVLLAIAFALAVLAGAVLIRERPIEIPTRAR